MNRVLGCNVHLASRVSLDLARAAGFGCVRVDCNWYDVEPQPDVWRWDVLDETVYGARERDLEPYLSLGYTPAWANGQHPRHVPPQHIEYWVTFVREVALRYGSNVWLYGVWNEPNITGYFAGTAEEYAEQLVIPAAKMLHDLSPDNKVCGPDLSTEGDWAPWLETCLRHCGGALDIVTVHCYQDTGRAVWQRMSQPPQWWQFWKPPAVRQVIQEAGYGVRPCWLTEVGWHTGNVSEAEQAAQYDQLFEGMMTNPWVERVFGFQLLDEGDGPGWGLFHQDRTPKPAVGVVQRYAKEDLS